MKASAAISAIDSVMSNCLWRGNIQTLRVAAARKDHRDVEAPVASRDQQQGERQPHDLARCNRGAKRDNSAVAPERHDCGGPVVAAGVVGLKITQRDFTGNHALGAIPEKSFVGQIDGLPALPEEKSGHDRARNRKRSERPMTANWYAHIHSPKCNRGRESQPPSAPSRAVPSAQHVRRSIHRRQAGLHAGRRRQRQRRTAASKSPRRLAGCSPS